jgi:hypothetical protein
MAQGGLQPSKIKDLNKAAVVAALAPLVAHATPVAGHPVHSPAKTPELTVDGASVYFVDDGSKVTLYVAPSHGHTSWRKLGEAGSEPLIPLQQVIDQNPHAQCHAGSAATGFVVMLIGSQLFLIAPADNQHGIVQMPILH